MPPFFSRDVASFVHLLAAVAVGWPPSAASFFASSEPMDIMSDALVAADAFLE